MERKIRLALLWDESFPGAESVNITKDNIIDRLSKEFDLLLIDPRGPFNSQIYDCECLVNLYGPYFPVNLWDILDKFLARGRGLVNLGGVPFRRPVILINDQWKIQTETQNYHREIFIRQAYKIPASEVKSYKVSDEVRLLEEVTDVIDAEEFYAFNMRYTYQVSIKKDWGSSGPSDGQLRTLLYGLDSEGTPVAAPVIAIDHFDGKWEGSRFVIGSFKPKTTFWLSPKLPIFLSKLISFASKKALLFHCLPGLASYYEGEKPSLIIRFRNYGEVPKDLYVEEELDNKRKVEVLHKKVIVNIKIEKEEKQIYTDSVNITCLENQNRTVIPLDIKIEPGIYHVICEFNYNDKESIIWHTGFWGYDEKLLTSGSELVPNKDYFEKDGKTCIITGTTYMSHDVHRKFLWMPNPWLWYQDMRTMKRIKINMIRTGIWYALRHLAFERGVISEECLRAMDAFLLSAKANELMVTFTFFAFIPEEWEGINPYLDPRSTSAQSDYLAAFAQRYKNVKGIHWDLINEPSVCSREKIWLTRPNYDKFELSLWRSWLLKRYKTIEELRDALRITLEEGKSFEDVSLPTLEDFGDIRGYERSGNRLKALEYFFFQHEIFRNWIKLMKHAIRSTGDTHLITVGQDEGGVETRPSNYYYSDIIDYTCIHSWHMNDQVLWICLTSKSPQKPNLLQEVGTTYLEDKDTIERRTPIDNANLLERKLITAIAGLTCGFIQWPWNSNTMMNSDGEASIGLWRDDGTYKPEIKVLEGINKFFRGVEEYMKNRKVEDVCLVIPFSHRYGELPQTSRMMAPEPSMTAIRILSYHIRVPLYCVGEHQIDDMIGIPKLIILPSVQIFDENSWTKLMGKVREGSTLLVTGAINFDTHLRPIPRTKSFGIETEEQYCFVAREEYMLLEDKMYPLVFPDWKMLFYKKAVLKENEYSQGRVFIRDYGKGKIIYCALPVEGSSKLESIEELYRFAIKVANITLDFQVEKDPSVLVKPINFEQATLYCIVNESSLSKQIKVNTKNSTFKVRLEGQRAALVMLNSDGEILASYPHKCIIT